MLSSPEPLRALVLGALYASAALATSPKISSFFDRRASSDEAVCGAANYSQCPQADLPSNFCCPSDQACILAAANTTVVCCPGGGDCRVIEPVKCDLNEANPSNPTALWKTEALDGSLPACGLGCCPWGWSCDNEGHCIKDDDQSQVPEGAILPSTSTSTIPSATISPKPTSTSEADSATSEASASEPQPADGSQRKGLSGPATAGLIAGIVLAILCAALIFFITARRRKQKDQGDHDRSTSSFGNIISEPILQGGIGAIRSDFGRAQESRVTSAGTGSTTVMGRPSIEGYWGSIGKPKPQMSQSSRGTTPVRMNTGKSAVGAPQISPIDMNDPFHDHHGLAISDDEAINPPTQRGPTAVPPIRSMKNKRPGSGDNSRLRPYPRPYTPPRQREPSGVEINVFADPDTVADSPGINIARSRFSRETRNTTFTEMMEKADLGDVNRGAPYVPKSAHNSPSRK